MADFEKSYVALCVINQLPHEFVWGALEPVIRSL